jgi:hypothetical protein
MSSCPAAGNALRRATRPATTGGQQTDAPAMPRHEAPAAGEKEILHHL